MQYLELEGSTIVDDMNELRQKLANEVNANKLILLAVLLNCADAVFTSLAIDLGVDEANPVMATVLKFGMTWFLFNKIIIINLMVLFVGLIGRNYRVGRLGIALIAYVYTFLTIYHMGNLCHLFMIGK
jgi:hypothetical protein